jgi:hypothetical protein
MAVVAVVLFSLILLALGRVVPRSESGGQTEGKVKSSMVFAGRDQRSPGDCCAGGLLHSAVPLFDPQRFPGVFLGLVSGQEWADQPIVVLDVKAPVPIAFKLDEPERARSYVRGLPISQVRGTNRQSSIHGVTKSPNLARTQA